ncbi:hypothetical protein N2152v2_003211 [Parachlorella kessleri]
MAEDEFGDFEAAPSVAAAATARGPVRAGVKGLAAPLPLELFEEHEVVAAPHAPSWDGTALPARPLHAKGELVWYSQRDGSWVSAQVVSVDVSVEPPSYGVLVEGRYRETEGHRLRAHIPGQTPPDRQLQQTAAQVATAPACPPPPPLQQQQQRDVQQPNGAYLATITNGGMVFPTPSGSPAYGLVVAGQGAHGLFGSEHAGQPSWQSPAALTPASVCADDDFGDFESAAPALTAPASQFVKAAVPPQQPLQQAAPPEAAARPTAGQASLEGPFVSSNGFAFGTAGAATPAAAAAAASGATDLAGLWQRWQQRQARSRQGSPDRLPRQQQQQQQQWTHGHAGQVPMLSQSLPKKPLTLQLPQPPALQPQQPSPHQQQQPSPHSTPPRSPLSPRTSSGQAAAAAQSPLGSPRRSSPAVDRFHSFLRFAAPHAAQRIESQDQEAAAAAAGSSAVDQWGDFGGLAAGLGLDSTAEGFAGSPTAAAHMKGPQLGHGVDRGAPLPLDIFGEEEFTQEDPPIAPLSQASMSPTVAGSAAVAAAPFSSAPPASPSGQQGGAPWNQQQQQREEPVVAVGGQRDQQGPQVPPAASFTGGIVGSAAVAAAASANAASCAPLAAPGSGAGDDWGEDSFGEFVDAGPGSEPPGAQPWLPSAAGVPAAWADAAPASQLAVSAGLTNGCLGAEPSIPVELTTSEAGVVNGDDGAAGMPAENGPSESVADAHASEATGRGWQTQANAASASLPLPAPAGRHGTGCSPSDVEAATATAGAAEDAVAEPAFEDWGSLDTADAPLQSVSNTPPEEPGSPAQGDGLPSAALAKPLEPLQEPPVVAAAVAAAAALGLPQVSHAGAPPPPAGQWEEVVTEYGVAWVMLLEAAARELERGGRLWREACEGGTAGALLAVEEAQRYLASLGQVFLAAAVVQVAARLLGLYGLVGELQQAWARCEAAWAAPAPLVVAQQQVGVADSMAADTVDCKAQPGTEQAAGWQGLATAEEPAGLGLSFQEAVLASSRSLFGPTADPSPSSGQQQQQQEGRQGELQQAVGLEAQLDAVQQAEAGAPGLSLDAFPRMLEWSEGLDGLTLLPLCLLEGALPVAGRASWLKGRPVLVPVANLWAGCLPRVLPDLD